MTHVVPKTLNFGNERRKQISLHEHCLTAVISFKVLTVLHQVTLLYTMHVKESGKMPSRTFSLLG